jgi:hopanoid-associated phosphorylase
VRPKHEPTIAVVTGLRAEARCLRGLNVRIAYSGGSSERARSEAARMVAEGAAGLVSFGIAGGLAPDLRRGDLVLPEIVLSPDGRSIPPDSSWRQRLGSRFEKDRLRAQRGALVGSDHVVATVADKQALRAATRALAVDMESHALAAVATASGVPFVVVRAIADPYDRVIPQAALETLRPDGRVRLSAVLGGVIRDPGQLLLLMHLGRDTASALAALRRVAPFVGASLELE